MKNILIASSPCEGKTYYAIDYYVNKIANGINGVFVSLELIDTNLMDKILEYKEEKNITLHKGGIINLYITSDALTIEAIIEYIEKIDTPIEYIIIDYLQLLPLESDFEAFFEYMKKKRLNVLMTSQITRGDKVEGEIFTDLLFRDQVQNLLKHFNEVKLLSKESGIIRSIENDKYIE